MYLNLSLGIQTDLLSTLEQYLLDLNIIKYSYSVQSSRASIVNLEVEGDIESLQEFLSLNSLPTLLYPLVIDVEITQSQLTSIKDSIFILAESLLGISIDTIDVTIRSFTMGPYMNMGTIDVSDTVYLYSFIPLSMGNPCYILNTDIPLTNVSEVMGYEVFKSSEWLRNNIMIIPQSENIRFFGPLMLVPSDMEDKVRDMLIVDENPPVSCRDMDLEYVMSLPSVMEHGPWNQLTALTILGTFLLTCEIPYDMRIKFNMPNPSLYYYSLREFFNVARGDQELMDYRDSVSVSDRGTIIVPFKSMSQLQEYTELLMDDMNRNEEWYSLVLPNESELLGTRAMIYKEGYSSLGRWNGNEYILVTNCPYNLRSSMDINNYDDEQIMGITGIDGITDGVM